MEIQMMGVLRAWETLVQATLSCELEASWLSCRGSVFARVGKTSCVWVKHQLEGRITKDSFNCSLSGSFTCFPLSRAFFPKDPDAGKDWRQEEKGKPEDEMAGRYHWLNGHEFEQALGDSEGQRSMVCCSPWGHRESDVTERLNNRYFLLSVTKNCVPSSLSYDLSTSLFIWEPDSDTLKGLTSFGISSTWWSYFLQEPLQNFPACGKVLGTATLLWPVIPYCFRALPFESFSYKTVSSFRAQSRPFTLVLLIHMK